MVEVICQHLVPMQEVGALLDADDPTDRSARQGPLPVAQPSWQPIVQSRHAEVLKMVELDDVADRQGGRYSLGMFSAWG